jgi:hypothetical protein
MSPKSGITVTVPKSGQLASVFDKMGDALPSKLRKATAQARRILVPALAEYPPERDGQAYERTEELKRGWLRASPIVGTRFELVNPSEHARWTQSDDQAWMHVGRWTPASEIAKEHEPEIVGLYDEAVKETTNP